MASKQNRNASHVPSAQKVVQKQVSDLVPYLQNARTHDKEQVSLIAESIKKFGFNNPVLLDGENGVIAGHGRLMAARLLKMTHVPCIELSHLTETQKKAYILADNQIALRSSWDEKMLKSELALLNDEGFDMKQLGFLENDLKALLVDPRPAGAKEDDIPELPEKAISVMGDQWILGRPADGHRVRCGDSTSAQDVSKLIGLSKPHLMVSDPPYGVKYEPSWREGKDNGTKKGRRTGVVENDNRADWKEAWALFPGNIAYVWHGGLHSAVVQQSLEACGYVMRAQIIWAKQQFIFSRGDYHWQHEPCWYAVKGTGKWCGDRKQSTVWEISNLNKIGGGTAKPEDDHTNHSTQKPVECMRRPILNNSMKGDCIYDPFLGSGSTVIAAEIEQRQCLGMELNPLYVDTIVKRWQNFTGKTAILEGTGQTFEEVARGRIS